MDRFELVERERLAEEEADSVKRALPRIDVETLSGERNATRFGKRKRKPRKNRQVGMLPHPIRTTNVERS
jgi:hypothetical protein